MLGSCCEEQEAKEAEARARIKAATRFNEERMLAGHRLREDLFKKLRCPEGCSCNDGGECGECEEEEEEQSQASGQKDGATAGSTPDADEDDDSLDEDAEARAQPQDRQPQQLDGAGGGAPRHPRAPRRKTRRSRGRCTPVARLLSYADRRPRAGAVR